MPQNRWPKPELTETGCTKVLFFASDRYIRVTRGDIGPGTVDPGYPKTISELGWGNFGMNGID
jgi:hypothetical protein